MKDLNAQLARKLEALEANADEAQRLKEETRSAYAREAEEIKRELQHLAAAAAADVNAMAASELPRAASARGGGGSAREAPRVTKPPSTKHVQLSHLKKVFFSH